jgi:hypothetical protein
MKNIIYVFFILLNINVYSQEWIDHNVIISVNEEIVPSSIGIKFKLTLKNGEKKIIEPHYLPGSLKIKNEDVKVLMNDSIKEIALEIEYRSINKEKIGYSFFTIDDLSFKKFTYDYLILRIYDTRLRKYKKTYNPIDGKQFTYDYDSPNGSMRRVKKR